RNAIAEATRHSAQVIRDLRVLQHGARGMVGVSVCESIHTMSSFPDDRAIVRSFRQVRAASATCVCILAWFASAANAADAFQWSGFALLRASNGVESGPLREEKLSAQLQVGFDW